MAASSKSNGRAVNVAIECGSVAPAKFRDGESDLSTWRLERKVIDRAYLHCSEEVECVRETTVPGVVRIPMELERLRMELWPCGLEPLAVMVSRY
jgi:hypothetical protein